LIVKVLREDEEGLAVSQCKSQRLMYWTLPAINKQGSSRLSHYRDKLVHDTTRHISIFMFCFLTKESFIFLPEKKNE
jgi:hypothetical protein